MNHKKRIVIIGSGIIGLTSCLRLKERGFDVSMITRDFPQETTSAVAAAFWYPYKVSIGGETLLWSVETYQEYCLQIYAKVPGLSMIPVVEFSREKAVPPLWFDQVKGYRRLDSNSLPSGFQDGHEFFVPLAEPSKYLSWLWNSLLEKEVPIIQEEISSIDKLFNDYDTVVNCSGLGARELVGDISVFPIRGQVQIIDALPEDGGHRIIFFQDLHHATYIVPRSGDCLIGGTADENEWGLNADPETAADIRKRCETLLPIISASKTKRHAVGLRPARKEIRLEVEKRNGKTIIHNYGHGGAGFTTCWGCAEKVVTLVFDN